MNLSPDKYKGRSVLITGGLGFIGSNLAHRLVEIGDVDITIIDSLSEYQGGNLFNIETIKDRVNLHIADMSDGWAINHLVGGIDYIFNLAGSGSHIDSMKMPQGDLQSNCVAQLTLLEACRMFNPHVKIVFTSTRQVYGKPEYLPLDENHRVQPADINGIHKRSAELYHHLYQQAYGLRTVSLRLTNTYGPRQNLGHGRQGFIAWFMRQALEGGIIELFGDGKQRRDLNYVDDVIEALLLAGVSEEAEGKIFNLGHHQIVNLADVAGEAIKLTGCGTSVGVAFPPDQQLIDIGNCYSSYQKIKQTLGWQPRVGLKEGLRRTIEFYQQNRQQYWDSGFEADENTVSKSYAAHGRIV